MKPITKNILIGLSIAVTVILILLLISFIVIYVLLVIEENEEHKKLEHCLPMIDAAERLEKELNVTNRFLRNPLEYKEVADKCDQAIKCVNSVDALISDDVLHTFRPCQFYVFYNRDFSTCADKLIAKKDYGIPCLDALFNDVNEPDVDKCHKWDRLQECFRKEINNLCGGQTTRYEKEAANLRPSICREKAEKV